MAEKSTREQEHSICLDKRSRLVITGVTDTDKFDESTVLLYTVMGELIVRGRDLHVNGLSLESGEMLIEGEISSITYGDSQVKGPLSLLGKMFK